MSSSSTQMPSLTVIVNYCRLTHGSTSRTGGGVGAARPFLFLGGHVTLNFVNTVLVEGGELVDRLSSPEELARWVGVSTLGREFGEPTDIAPGVFCGLVGRCADGRSRPVAR